MAEELAEARSQYLLALEQNLKLQEQPHGKEVAAYPKELTFVQLRNSWGSSSAS